jgi:hypothetical protein
MEREALQSRERMLGVLLDLGESAEALALLERAWTVRQQEDAPTRRAETAYALARALWSTGGDRNRAKALATDAEQALRRWRGPDYAQDLIGVRALASHSSLTLRSQPGMAATFASRPEPSREQKRPSQSEPVEITRVASRALDVLP